MTDAATPLRDLDDAAFTARYGCDRFTATVLGNRMSYLVEHMCGHMLTAAFSPILRDMYDFAATVTGPPELGYPTSAMSNSIVLFTGSMGDAIRVTISEYGVDRLAPGDVIIGNDPYRMGTHVNDILFCRPVFTDEPDRRLVGFVSVKAHQLDAGGIVPGGFSIVKRNVYEDGLVLSPRALYSGGKPVRETFSLIFDNVRFGEILLPDMQTICAELDLGERLLAETVRRYGVAAVHGAMTYLCDASEERMAAGLRELPDGRWEGEDTLDCDAVDDSETYRVHVTVTKHGERVEVDFSGSSRQARSSVNCTALDAKTTVGVTLKYLLDPQGRFTSGAFRCADVVIPDGTVVSALPPDGAVFAYYEQSQVIMSAILRALAPAVGPNAIAGDHGCPEIHNAAGVYPDGTPWVSTAQAGGDVGPLGATRHGDADSQAMSYQNNGMLVAAEAVEAQSPVVVLRHEIATDTAGPGYHRGGAAVVRDSLWLQPAEHYLMALRYKNPPGFGVNGGRAGRTGGVWNWPPTPEGSTDPPPMGTEAYADAVRMAGRVDPQTGAPSDSGDYVYPYERPSWHTDTGAMLRYLNSGGGGWGDPLQRDPEQVRLDVRDGYVSIAGAARDYGVVVTGDPERDPEGVAVDIEATKRLRDGRAANGAQAVQEGG